MNMQACGDDYGQSCITRVYTTAASIDRKLYPLNLVDNRSCDFHTETSTFKENLASISGLGNTRCSPTTTTKKKL